MAAAKVDMPPAVYFLLSTLIAGWQMAFTFEKLIVYQKAVALFSGNLVSRRGISGRSTLMVVLFLFPGLP